MQHHCQYSDPHTIVEFVRDSLLTFGSLSDVPRDALNSALATLTSLLSTEPLKSSVLPSDVVACLSVIAVIPGGESGCVELLGMVAHSASRAACVDSLFDISAALPPESAALPSALRCYKTALDNLVSPGDSSDAALLLLLDHLASIIPQTQPLSAVQAVALPYSVLLAETAIERTASVKCSGSRSISINRARGKLDALEAAALVVCCDEQSRPVLAPLVETSSVQAVKLALLKVMSDIVCSTPQKVDPVLLGTRARGVKTLASKIQTDKLVDIYDQAGLIEPLKHPEDQTGQVKDGE